MFHVNEMPPCIEADLCERAHGISSATIGHLLTNGFLANDIRPVLSDRRIAGCAVTLALSGQDSTLLHYAVGLLRPGDVLVIDRLGDNRHACLGGGVGFAAMTAGAIGAVIDGPCTDPDELIEIGFPVWCRGVSPITTRLQGLGGTMNSPVCCAGAVVNPGDLIIADPSGVVAIPRNEARQILEDAHTKEARSRKNMERVRKGGKLGDCSGATAMVLANLADNSHS